MMPEHRFHRSLLTLVIGTLCLGLHTTVFATQVDGERVDVYDPALDTSISEHCARYRTGNAKCHLTASSNLASLKCVFLTQYSLTGNPPSITAYTMTEEEFYDSELGHAVSPGEAAGDSLFLNSSIGQALVASGARSSLTSFPNYRIYSVPGRQIFHSFLGLGDSRAVELSVAINRDHRSYSLSLTQFSLHGDSLLQANPVSCTRQWAGNGEYDRFDRRAQELENGENVRVFRSSSD